MRALYLIKHASPTIDPATPPEQWVLSERGRAESEALAAIAAGWGLAALYTSSEPKARSSGLVIGDAVGLAPTVVDGFEEIHTGWIANSDQYSEVIRDLLEHPDRQLRGVETAAGAAARFQAGVGLVANGPFPAAIVSHGRVLTAWLSSIGAIEEPFAYWRAMAMGSWTRIDLDAPKAPPFEAALP